MNDRMIVKICSDHFKAVEHLGWVISRLSLQSILCAYCKAGVVCKRVVFDV